MSDQLLLLLDTHAPEAHVILATMSGEILHEVAWAADKTMGVKLLAAIDEVLSSANKQWSDVQRLGVHEGPGHYSALRTGIVTGSLLASEKKVELIGISGEQKEDWVKQAVENKPVAVLTPKY